METRGLTRTVQTSTRWSTSCATALDALVAQNAELGGDDVHTKALPHARQRDPGHGRACAPWSDQLEKVVPDDYWPLPTYRDMLFVK